VPCLLLPTYSEEEGLIEESCSASPVAAKKVEEKTTVMIRNLPTKYKQEFLVEDVAALVPGFDFLYMPPARKDGKSNKGFAFVNFCRSEDAVLFMKEFEGARFCRAPNSIKKASVQYADVQGFAQNVQLLEWCRIAKSSTKPYVQEDSSRLL